MKKTLKLILALLIIPLSALAQSTDISGIVKDAGGEPIIGAVVYYEGTSVMATTDSKGYYSIVGELGKEITFSCFGFKTEIVTFSGQKTIDVVLKLDAVQLEDAVVIGYGTQQRQDLTGSISSHVGPAVISIFEIAVPAAPSPLTTIFTFLISLLMTNISKRCVYTMRRDAFNKMLNLPIAYFDRNQIGDIISRMSYDIDTVNTSLSTDLVQILTSIITIIGSFVMMITVSPLLVLVFAVTLPISLLFTRVMIKKTSKHFKARSHNLGVLSGFNEEMITGIKTIKAYGKEDEIINNFNAVNETAANSSYLAEYYSAYTGPGVNFVNNLSLSLICLFGAILYKANKLTLGDISSFVLYSKKFSGPINEIANILSKLIFLADGRKSQSFTRTLFEDQIRQVKLLEYCKEAGLISNIRL